MEPASRSIPELALLARQPIFDASLQVVAHELLYRSHPDAQSARIVDPQTSTARVILDACLEFGLDQLVGSCPAHINFPRELLRIDTRLPVPPKRIVVEVLEDVRADCEVIESLVELRARGHMIALDDFSFEDSDIGLLAFAHIVKLDLRKLGEAELKRAVRELQGRKLKLVAEKVESHEELQHCVGLGFHAFQGYFLRRPETFSRQRVPSSRLATLRIMAELQGAEVDFAALERAVARDAATSYRIMRCINSSFYSLPRPVSDLRQAIVILGIDELRRLCALIVLGGFEDRPPQLITDALVRARMCELMARSIGAEDAGPFFVTGLFSLLDVLLGQPLEQILATLPLSDPVRQALLTRSGELGRVLDWVIRYEEAAWEELARCGVARHELCRAYLDAVQWAETGLSLK